MESVEEYLIRKHIAIKDDYTDANDDTESCTIIASAVAFRLLQEGKEPFLVEVTKKDKSPEKTTIHPALYGGRIAWGGHITCCCGVVIFDPLIGKPVRIKEFTKSAFLEEVELKPTFSREETKELAIKYQNR